MTPGGAIKVGVLLWSQSTDWPTFKRAAVRVDELGYSHLWTWDHLLPIFGELRQPILEGWTTLGALAMITKHVDIGLLVGANTFRGSDRGLAGSGATHAPGALHLGR